MLEEIETEFNEDDFFFLLSNFHRTLSFSGEKFSMEIGICPISTSQFSSNRTVPPLESL